MRRRSFLTGLALAPVGAAWGCSGPDGPASAGGRARISYGVWDQLQVPAMQAVIEAFTAEHPEIEVELQVTPFTTYWTRLQTSITGGGAPDVFWMNGPNLAKFAAYDTLLPLGGRLAAAGEDLSAHPENLVELYRYDGEQYGVPKDYDCISLYYNTELFDAAAVPYPDDTWTWETVREALPELRDPARGQFGISSAIDRQRNLYPAIFQNEGWVIRDGRSGFADEATIGGLRYWTELIAADLAPNAMATADTDGRALFLGGNVAMFHGLPNDAAAAYEDPAVRERTNLTVLPRGRVRGNVIHGLANVVNARTRYPDAAFELVRFMAGRLTGEIQGESGSALPSYLGTETSYLASKPDFALRSFIDQVPDATAYPVSLNTNTWENLQYQILGEAWIGAEATSVAEASRRLAAEMDTVLAEEPR